MGKSRKVNNEKKIKQKYAAFNWLCAGLCIVPLLLFFCNFFSLSIDGKTSNAVSGFKMAFFGGLNDNVLSVINNSYPSKVMFAQVMSFLCLISIIALMCLFIYQAIKKQKIFSRYALLAGTIVLVIFIMQTIAYSGLTSVVTKEFYAGCATCIAETLSYLSLILYVVVVGAIIGINEYVSRN